MTESKASDGPAPSRGSRSRRRQRRARSLIICLWAIIGAVLLFFGAFLTPYRVQGGSMRPLFAEGDLAWVWRLAYGFRLGGAYMARWASPEPGQVVVALNPLDGALIVKRCVARSGDPLFVAADTLTVAGERVPLGSDQAFHLFGLRSVPPGEVFLLGDNSGESQDSREYGPLPVAAVIGMVIGSIHRR